MVFGKLKPLRNVCFLFVLVADLVVTDSPSFKVCTTKECTEIGDKIWSTMNTSIDPCDDFYTFVCGRYIEETEIEKEKSSASISDEVDERILKELSEALTNRLPKKLKFRPFEMAQTFYKQCMDKKGIDELGLEEAKLWYKRFGGWPVLEGTAWNDLGFDWLNTTLLMYKHGFGYSNIFECDVYPDPRNTTARIIEIKMDHEMTGFARMGKTKISQADLGVDAEFLRTGLEEKIVEAYYKLMVDVAVMYGASRLTAKRELKKSLEFEIRLATISVPMEQMRNHSKLFNPMTMAELQNIVPSVPWTRYFREVVPKSIEFPRSCDERINVLVPSFFMKLEKLLKETPKRVIANYLLWRCASENIPYLTSEMIQTFLKFLKVVTGTESVPQRYKECVDSTAGMYDLVVSAIYVRLYAKPNLKSQAMDIVRRIHREMVKLLQRVTWMDKGTRIKAIDKAHTMLFQIGYPEELFDNGKLETFYKKVSIGSNYFDSLNTIMAFVNQYDFGLLDKPINKSDWRTHCSSHAVNAYYSAAENSIEIPAGILRSPFFSPDRPSYLNYGGIGYVIAHEMIHAFDDEGSQYDKDGNLFEWWDEKTKHKYMAKARLIVKEYSNFTVKEINKKLKGVNTQGENIADHAGIKLAYKAYEKWASQCKEEPRLPKLVKFTPKQMFWISAGHSWCTKYRPEKLKVYVTTGYHPPAEYRINGPFRYSKYFAKDFMCPVGSFMNSGVNANVW